MSAAHTPGPWLIRQGDEWTKDIVTHGGYASQGEPMYWNVASCNKQRDECDANLLLIAAAPELLEALRNFANAQNMSQYGDSSGFVWPKSTMRYPGEHVGGYICATHGLGYQSSCICCRDDYEKFADDKDRDARRNRDDALKAADTAARAVIAKATGSTT